MRDFVRVERFVAGEEVFVFARGKDARVQAEFAEQVAVAKAVADDADGADDACRVGVDFVGGGGDVVRTRCADVGDDGVHRQVAALAFQALDGAVNGAGLYRRAAAGVDVEDDGFGHRVFEGFFEAGDDVVGVGFHVGCDHALHADDGKVFAAVARPFAFGVAAFQAEKEAEEEQPVERPEDAEKDFPAAFAPHFDNGFVGDGCKGAFFVKVHTISCCKRVKRCAAGAGRGASTAIVRAS